MSTNYYAKVNDAPALEPLHIGKHSVGWEFLWRAHPELELTSTKDWRRFMDHPWITIVAEHGLVHKFDEFWSFATRIDDTLRRQDESFSPQSYPRWRDDAGFPFADYEFC